MRKGQKKSPLKGWEVFQDRNGQKDVRPIGAKTSFGTVPAEYRKAKAAAVAQERQRADMADFRAMKSQAVADANSPGHGAGRNNDRGDGAGRSGVGFRFKASELRKLTGADKGLRLSHRANGKFASPFKPD